METNFDNHKKELLEKPEFRKEYERLQPKYDKVRFEELMKEGYLEMAEENKEWAEMVWSLACEVVNGNITERPDIR